MSSDFDAGRLVLLGVVSLGFLAGGILYLLFPRYVQRLLVKRMAIYRKRPRLAAFMGVSYVESESFTAFLRLAGAVALLVGLFFSYFFVTEVICYISGRVCLP